MPHNVIQRAADRLNFLVAGTTPSPWFFDGEHTITSLDGNCVHTQGENDSQSRLDAEYIFALQPDVGLAICEMLESQATLHAEHIEMCYYCNPLTNPIHLDCPVLVLARSILNSRQESSEEQAHT